MTRDEGDPDNPERARDGDLDERSDQPRRRPERVLQVRTNLTTSALDATFDEAAFIKLVAATPAEISPMETRAQE